MTNSDPAPTVAPDTPADPRRAAVVRRIGLVGTLLISAVVGVWAFAFPREFYDSFPVVLGEWVSVDGPFNEHLVRDHGAQYLALGAASLVALVIRSVVATRVLGVAWTVFGVLHLAYHATHLEHLDASDGAEQLTVIALALLLGVAMMVGPRPHILPRRVV